MTIIEFICWTFGISLFDAWVIILSGKQGWREWLQVHADAMIFGQDTNRDFFNRLFNCNFCLSWWIAVVICLFLLMITGEWAMLAVPFCSTSLTTKWLK